MVKNEIMEYNRKWFMAHFEDVLNGYQVSLASSSTGQFGVVDSVKFNIAEKVEGIVLFFSSGVINVSVFDENTNGEVINSLIVEKDVELAHTQKEDVFSRLMNLLIKYKTK